MFKGKSGAIARAGAAALAALLHMGTQAGAQDYPARAITIVVPYPGGGTADLIPRILMDGMAATLGQALVIENRTGASGTPGANSVARAAPDGYTLLATVTPTHSVNMFLQKNFPYDPVKSFEPIVLAGSTVLLMAVHPSLPVKSVKDLIDYARANPGKVVFGSAGAGTGQHIIGELLKKRAGIDMTHLPYRGTGPMMADLVSGQFQLAFTTPTAVLPLIESNKLRLVAVAEAKRWADMPDLPTVSETVPGIDYPSWYAFFAPAGTPRAIIDKINAAANKELQNPRVLAKFKEQGVNVLGGTPEDLTAMVKKDLERWRVDIPLIGLEPQ